MVWLGRGRCHAGRRLCSLVRRLPPARQLLGGGDGSAGPGPGDGARRTNGDVRTQQMILALDRMAGPVQPDLGHLSCPLSPQFGLGRWLAQRRYPSGGLLTGR